MKKKIVSLKTIDGTEYQIGQEAPDVRGRDVNHIEFKVYGFFGVTKGAPDETSYTIVLVSQTADKDIVTMIVPFSKVARFITVDVEESEEPEPMEKMQKVD